MTLRRRPTTRIIVAAYGREHSGSALFLVIGWLAALPASVPYAYGLRAIWRALPPRSTSRTAA